jgi:hypothetical protein
VAHDPDSKHNTALIGIKIGVVQRCYGWLFRIFNAEEKVKTRNILGEIRKILGNHLGFDIPDIPLSQGPG